jgi:hypothetical protein
MTVLVPSLPFSKLGAQAAFALIAWLTTIVKIIAQCETSSDFLKPMSFYL